jgi:hypothetical protein
MIYHEDKSSSVAFPVVVILLAMVAIVVSLALSSGHQTSARVWVPGSSGGLHMNHHAEGSPNEVLGIQG